MRKIQDWAAGIFIACTAILTIVAVLGIWQVFAHDVILKSFRTLWLVALISVVVIVASRYIGNRSNPGAPQIAQASDTLFSQIRRGTLLILIIAASLLALIGVLAIWQVLAGDVMGKSLSSIAVIVFSSVVVVMMCLEREGDPRFGGPNVSIWGIIAFLIIGWVIIEIFGEVFTTIMSFSDYNVPTQRPSSLQIDTANTNSYNISAAASNSFSPQTIVPSLTYNGAILKDPMPITMLQTQTGIQIFNQANLDYTNCTLSLNVPGQQGMNNIPFKTTTPFSVPANEPVVISYAGITDTNGTAFETPTLRQINNLVLDCLQGSNHRYWAGYTQAN